MILNVTVDRVLYTSASSWRILGTDQGKALGVIRFAVEPGDALILDGEWQRSDYSGAMEFKFVSATYDIPADPRSLLTYAVSITTGLGDQKELEIWAAYGPSWRDHPDLDGIKSISATTRYNWTESLKRLLEHTQMASAISFLLSKKLSMNLANVAWEEWKEATIPNITNNLYILASLPHYGFHSADALRSSFGISDDDPRRADACLFYCLNECVQLGDTAPSLSDVSDLFVVYLDITAFTPTVQRLIDTRKIVCLTDSLEVKRLAIYSMYLDELAISKRFTK